MSSKEKLHAFFKTDYPLNKEGLNELFSSFVLKKASRGAFLIQEGRKEHSLRFLNHGIIRTFYKNSEKERNINFFTQPQFFTDFSSFIHDLPTKQNQEALTGIEYFEIGRDTFYTLLDKYQCGQQFIQLTFQKLLQEKEQQEFDRITKKPEVLYENLFKHKSHWLHLIPQYHIASYLGVTPETLSRIRKRIS